MYVSLAGFSEWAPQDDRNEVEHYFVKNGMNDSLRMRYVINNSCQKILMKS